MQHLIVGYGYTGHYLAEYLIKAGEDVTGICRNFSTKTLVKGMQTIAHDLESKNGLSINCDVLYYLAPPPAQGHDDVRLKRFINQLNHTPKHIIYFSTSGVYGCHDDQWVDEDTPVVPQNDRHYRRLDAERQWLEYCQQHAINLTIARVTGIYGPNRIPLAAAENQTPLIIPAQAPWINMIYVKDLVNAIVLLAQQTHGNNIVNICDGQPQPMGTSQRLLAKLMQYQAAKEISWQTMYAQASPMKREFMQGSKKLSNKKLIQLLNSVPAPRSLETGIIDALKEMNIHPKIHLE